MKSALLAIALLCFGLFGAAQAAIDTHEFVTEADRGRYQQLVQTLRCPKCQNQNIADSNSPIANDLRAEVHRMLNAGQSNQQIIDFMVDRYGEFVLYDPPFETHTLLLWLGPAGLLLAGAAALLARVARSRRLEEPDALSDAERLHLAELLRCVDTSKTTHD